VPITLDDIVLYTRGVPIEYAFLEIGVRDEVPKPKQCGMRLLSGTIRALEDLVKEGVIIKKLFAVSSVADGIKLCREFGFKEIPLTSEGNRLGFELDIETSTSLYVRDYRQIVQEK